jgi:methionyl-tRNA synthetase
MSKYQDRLIKYIEDNHSYILPETRRNEVLGFLKNNALGDLCISRPVSRLSWGITFPFDEKFVTYVWFDALVNYFSATRYLAPHAERAAAGDFWWPADHHLVGKDILTTHAVYWSTMLMALKFPLPDNIFAHGWWTVDGKKMSKSIGNVVDPNVMIEKYGVDAFRYFLFREVPFGLDGDFSEEALINRINTELANDLGNLLSRFLTMAEKYLDGEIKELESFDRIDDIKRQCIEAGYEADYPDRNWVSIRFNVILEYVWERIRAANNYIAQKEPWKLAKSNPTYLKEVLFNIWNALRQTAVSLYPFMPDSAETMWKQLGLQSLTEEVRNSLKESGLPEIYSWDWFPPYPVKLAKGEQLFPRIDLKKETAKEKEHKHMITEDNLIAIEDFAKVKLKIGKVLQAERVPKSNKLIKLQVDTGEPRQIVAGIGQAYAPEDLVGKLIVVVANLKPAKLMGVESQGMLLAATDDSGVPVVLMPEKSVKEGAGIK